MPFVARNDAFSTLIGGKLNIPAIIAITPITTVVKCVILFEVIPFAKDLSLFILASKIKPIPIININNDSTWLVISNSKIVWVTIEANPNILTIARAVINFCDTLTVSVNLFFMDFYEIFLIS